MPSATELLGPGGASLLRAVDLPENQKQLVVTFKEVRRPPEGIRAKLIAELTQEPVPGRNCLPLNDTNIRALVSLLGDDYSKWAGASVLLYKIPVRNPQTNQMTWGLRVHDAKAASGKIAGKKRSEPDDEVPF
jgi:hypothetical protein